MRSRRAPTTIGEALAAALPGWLTARVLVLGALALARFLADHMYPSAQPRVHPTLMSWDAMWYRDIAAHGYAAIPQEALRFFPLLPLLARPLRAIGVPPGVAVTLIANVAALALGMLVYGLARSEGASEALGRRAAWLVALAPPAFVLVMGYSEAPALALSVAAMWALRRQRWGWAAAAGFLVGLARPLGVLMAVPALVEASRHLRRARGGERMARLAAVAAAPAGAAAYMLWVGWQFGDVLLPVRLQGRSDLRGSFANPVTTLLDAGKGLASGDRVGFGLHLPWVVLLVVLLVVTFRRWPVAYGALAAATLAVSLTSANLNSIERYGLGAFPLVLAASVLERPNLERAALAASAAGLVVYAMLAFVEIFVP